MKRCFEFIGSDGKTAVEHSKFWEVWVDGVKLRSRYGKIGANGQTTVKSFASEPDAEAAKEKAITEKTKKGYVEKTEGHLTHEVNTGNVDLNDPEIVAAKALYQQWVLAHKPSVYINFHLEEIPEGLDEDYIWSEGYGDESNYLMKGFYSSSMVEGYYITAIPAGANDPFDYVETELTRYCETCDAEGEVDGDLCSVCDGSGSFYIATDEFVLPIIATQEELDDYMRGLSQHNDDSGVIGSSPGANFCSECGTRRGSPTAKFCGDCGTAI